MTNKDISFPHKLEVKALFAQAVANHHAGKLGDAEILYQRILTMDGKHVGALNNLGALHLQRGNLQEGVRLIECSLEINPYQPSAHNNRGVALRDLKRLDAALASYDRALTLKPDYAEAHNNRGVALQELQRW